MTKNNKNRLPRRLTLDRSLVRGLAWTGVARWSGQVVSWAVLLYAARVLSPDDFGIVAMAMVPIGLARLIEDLGLDAAIVQNRDLSDTQIASLGTVALSVGIVLCGLYIATADLLASFFREPKVASIIRAFSLLFVLDALQIVPRAQLQRNLQFGRLALVNGIQLSSSALILGACTWFNLSYWALVFNHIFSHIIIVVILFGFYPPRFHRPGRWSEIASSLKFGGSMLVSRIAWYGYTSIDQAVLGRISGAASLGAYNFAMTFARIPVDEIGSLSGKVVPGIFSTVQKSAAKLTRYLLIITEATSYLIVPATIGIALVAGDFVHIAIGPQWTDVIIPLQLLAIYTCMAGVTVLWSHVLIWTGHARLNMYLNLLALLLLPPAFWIGTRLAGATGVALAWAAVFPVTLVPTFWFVGRILRLRFSRFLRCLGPAIISAAVMTAVVVTLRLQLADNLTIAVRFLITVGAGVAAYSLTLFGLFGARIRRVYRTIRRSM